MKYDILQSRSGDYMGPLIGHENKTFIVHVYLFR